MSPIKTDYLVIGADAHTVMVDRRHRPGDRGNESSPFRAREPAGGPLRRCVRLLPTSRVVGAYEVKSLVIGVLQPVKMRRRGLVAPRLNAVFNSALCIGSEETEKTAPMQRHRQAIKPAVARWPELIATLA